MRYQMVRILLTLCLIPLGLVQAEEIIPSEKQTTTLRGTAEVTDGIRAVTGTVDKTGHGPITYYTVPFQEGTFSLSLKVDEEQKIVLVFDGKPNGKATHAMKVYINGSPGKTSNKDDLTIMTYDGSTKQNKKATFSRNKYYAKPGQWHQASITFQGQKATVVVDDKTYTVTSERFREPIEKCAIGHFSGTLHTKDVKIRIIN